MHALRSSILAGWNLNTGREWIVASSIEAFDGLLFVTLAISRNAKLSTLDARIDSEMLYGGHEAFLLIE